MKRRLRSKRTKNNALAVQFSGQNRVKLLLLEGPYQKSNFLLYTN